MAKAGRRGSHVAICECCKLRWRGTEAYAKRKASHHIKEYGHHVGVGPLGGVE